MGNVYELRGLCSNSRGDHWIQQLVEAFGLDPALVATNPAPAVHVHQDDPYQFVLAWDELVRPAGGDYVIDGDDDATVRRVHREITVTWKVTSG